MKKQGLKVCQQKATPSFVLYEPTKCLLKFCMKKGLATLGKSLNDGKV